MGLLDDKNGKRSSKRVMGFSAGYVGLTMAILSGFDFYTPAVGIVGSIFGFAGLLLGIGVFEKKNKEQ